MSDDLRFYVEIVRRARPGGDEHVVKTMGPHAQGTAERILRGVEINLDHDRFYAAKLIAAARLVEEVATALDTTWLPCDCCGAQRYKNFTDKQAADALSGALTRIHRVEVTLRADDNQAQPRAGTAEGEQE